MKVKKHTLKVENPKPGHTAIVNLLMTMPQSRLNELAKEHGSPVKKYKDDTAEALAVLLSVCNPSATLTLTFTK
jgi:predicted RNase H-like nuclease (RuvC/YqgF family)